MTMAEFVELANEATNDQTVDDTKFLRLASRSNVSSLISKVIKAGKENAALKVRGEMDMSIIASAETVLRDYIEAMNLMIKAFLDKDAHAQEEAVSFLQTYREGEIKI